MKINLRVQIGILESEKSDIPGFLKWRERLLKSTAEGFRRYEPVHHDQGLEFRNISPAERRSIEERFQQLGNRFGFSTWVTYESEEILAARFSVIGIDGDEIDWVPKECQPLNIYPKRLCDTCWSYDLTVVPEPYVVQRPKKKMQAIFHASNGIVILTSALWQQLKDTLGPWVRTGRVAYLDSPQQSVDEFVWIMPMQLIGANTKTLIAQHCEVCGRPTYAYWGKDPEILLLFGMEIVTEIPPTDAPIALVGMWSGCLKPGTQPDVSWPVAISGDLCARLLKMKVKGFGLADKPIHTQMEVNALLDPTNK